MLVEDYSVQLINLELGEDAELIMHSVIIIITLHQHSSLEAKHC